MSKVRKAIRVELLKKKETLSYCQKAVDTFNSSINKSMQELNKEIMDLETELIKLER